MLWSFKERFFNGNYPHILFFFILPNQPTGPIGSSSRNVQGYLNIYVCTSSNFFLHSGLCVGNLLSNLNTRLCSELDAYAQKVDNLRGYFYVYVLCVQRWIFIWAERPTNPCPKAKVTSSKFKFACIVGHSFYWLLKAT